MGFQPWWYPVVAAARYYRVSPFVLMDQPTEWIHRAAAAMYAEGHAQSMHHKK